MTYNTGDIVVVPFPFVDGAEVRKRPAVVISSGDFNAEHRHAILAMVTTAKRSRWESDLPIRSLKPAGLPIPSIIRMKLFTLDERFLLRRLGRLSQQDQKALQKKLCGVLGI